MVLFLHNRYRTTGGEERAVEDLLWLVREQLGEPAELLRAILERALGRDAPRAGCCAAGSTPSEVARRCAQRGARVVHAHNLQPALGWRALAAARAAGARVVLHLHQYRLVCAIGVCFTHGAECTRCHGRNTLPGVRLNCRGSAPEALAYGASLALWQRRMVEQADAMIVPSAFARERLRELGAPLPWERVHVLAPPLRALEAPPPPRAAESRGELRAGRLAAGAGEGRRRGDRRLPYRRASRWSSPATVRSARARSARRRGSRPSGATCASSAASTTPSWRELRAGAAIALVPSRSAETFGLAAAEAMAAGLPVAASRVGALPELLEDDALVPAGDAGALAQAIARLAGDRAAGARGRERVSALCAPEVVGARAGAGVRRRRSCGT